MSFASKNQLTPGVGHRTGLEENKSFWLPTLMRQVKLWKCDPL